MCERTETIHKVGSEEGFWDEPAVGWIDDWYWWCDSDVEELLFGLEMLHEIIGWEPTISCRGVSSNYRAVHG